MSGQRADARRNYALLLAVAGEEIARYGADASMEQIARKAGVGSGTVRRHFPTRQVLLEAVFRTQVEALCARARELAETTDARTALLTWLRAVTASAATIRGLAVALAHLSATEHGAAHDHCATAQLTEAGGPLVRRAAKDGAVAADVDFADLLTLITGLALATEHHSDPAAEATRLLDLALAGISPTTPSGQAKR